MKKSIILIIFVFLLVSLFFILGCSNETTNKTEKSKQTSIKTSCPRGLINDSYPGSCSDYIDLNNNSICDRSEPQ